MLESGVLRRIHHGVYVAVSAPSDHGVLVRAALKALKLAGPHHSTAASHCSAAWLQGMLEQPPDQVHVTTSSPYARTLKGVNVHRTGTLLRRRPFQGVPCTLPARTLVDLATTVTPANIAQAVDRAVATRILRIGDLEAEIRKGHRRGTEQLRRCLEERGLTGAPAPSVLESRMARLIARHRLPLPTAEVIAGPNGEYRIDYANPAKRLAVELYGYAHHHSPQQMAYDHARQRKLTIQGWTVLVFTWQDVTNAPERVAREIRVTLAALAGPAGPGAPPSR